MNEDAHFLLNGRPVSLAGENPTQSLLRWLHGQRLTGTKEGCGDGDCGACTVAVVAADAGGRRHYQAWNSCLLPLGSLPGREVFTVEALAEGERLHPVQQALVDCAGSQCGYCTPGFVMSLFVGNMNREFGDAVIEGNLCRCTGYRPIREAAAQLAAAATADTRFGAVLAQTAATPAEARLGQFFSPTTLAAAISLKQQYPAAQWIQGATDLGVALGRGQPPAPAYISLERVAELQRLDVDADRVWIGAGVSLSRLETELAGVLPALDQMLPWFAARQVKNRATFGGNLGSASPIGDLLPILLALDARIHLRGPDAERDLPANGFFLAYRQTQRRPEELIVGVEIPRRPVWISAAYKVAKRQTDDISIVAAAFALCLDPARRVQDARLAYGGVAALPLRASGAEALLLGRVLDEACLGEVAAALATEFQPLDDHRASAAYRRRLCASLFERFVRERLP
ncbi:MAG: xanthine dehydrogenase small subunit [Lysobacterales bacterium]